MKKGIKSMIFFVLVNSLLLSVSIAGLFNYSCYAQDPDTTEAIEVKIKKRAAPKTGVDTKKQEETLSPDERAERAKRSNLMLIEESIKQHKLLVPEMLARLKSPDPEVRVSAAGGLAKAYDRRAIAPLIQILRSDSVPLARGFAAMGLGFICSYHNDSTGVEQLKKALDDGDKGVATRAALALVRMERYDAVVPTLISIVQGENLDQWQVEGFNDLRHIRSKNERFEMLNEIKMAIRKWALMGLEEIGDKRVKIALQNILPNTQNNYIKRRIKSIIQKIDTKIQNTGRKNNENQQ